MDGSGVYQPDDDSFLLEKAVKRFSKGAVLDIGTGSGIQAVAAAKRKCVKSVVAVDVNPAALVVARENALKAGAAVSRKISFLKSDLFSSLRGRKFDTIVFNPPYLPTAWGEHVSGALDKAFDGGANGRRVIDKFVSQVKHFLRPGGVVLLVSSSLAATKMDGTGNAETVAKLEKRGFTVQVVGSERFFFEELVVVKAVCQPVGRSRR